MILRAAVLRLMDIKETPDGKQTTFAIAFDTKEGERIFLPRAVSCGLRFKMKENRYRGVLAVDKNYEPIGHAYPVHIDNIIEFNHQKVKL